MPANTAARARRRSRYISAPADPLSEDAALFSQDDADRLAQQVMAMTISDEGPDVDTQPSKLWTSRGQFQGARPALQPSVDTSAVLKALCGTASSHQDPLPTAQSTPIPLVSAFALSSPATSPLEQHAPLLTSTLEEVLDEQANPARMPRRSAAEKEIETQLTMASRIGIDLCQCEEKAKETPSLERYYQLRDKLRTTAASIELLNRRDARVQARRMELLGRCDQLRRTLAAWSGIVLLPREPRIVDTSKCWPTACASIDANWICR